MKIKETMLMLRFRLKELIQDKSFKEGRRVTLGEVSESTGIHKTTLSRLQNPTGYNTTTETINLLCKYFQCEVGDLVVYIND
jgi:putative transcriptional regulator